MLADYGCAQRALQSPEMRVEGLHQSQPVLSRCLGSADSALSVAVSLAGSNHELLCSPPSMKRAAAASSDASCVALYRQTAHQQFTVRLI